MTEIPGMVERIGRAIAGLRRGDYEKDFALFDAEACAIVVAHEAALRDAGMVIVPREPTEEMCDEATRSTSAWMNSKLKGIELRRLKHRIRYGAMIAAGSNTDKSK